MTSGGSSQNNKKKKLLLKILLPISLFIVALSIFLGCFVGCNKKVDISQSTINNEKYKVPKGTPIQYDPMHTITLGHDLFNLKAWSVDHNNKTDFVIGGAINFGFLVDFDMDCHLIGANNEIMRLDNVYDDNASGVIIGETTRPTTSLFSYSGHMDIEPSMTFNIGCGGETFGVFSGSTSVGSILTINGTFIIGSAGGGAFGICIGSGCSVSGSIIINGLIRVYTSTKYGKRAAVFALSDDASVSGSITINGILSVSTLEPSAPAYYFCEDSGGDITGPITISDKSVSTISSGGDWTVGGDSTVINGFISNATINGFLCLTGGETCSMYNVNENFSSTKLSMSSSQFFSNRDDSAFSWLPNRTAYNWNGSQVISSTSGPNTTTPDVTLALKDIVDNDKHPNFGIEVIETAGILASKTTFNKKYKEALQAYVKKCGASIAKPWLKKIISKIPL